MHIETIKVKNFQGVSNVALDVHQPILFIAGFNGAGKSSLRDAIRIALTGAASRVTLKKDYKAMIKEGTKKSEIVVGTDEGAYTYLLPQAKGVHSDSEYLPLCIDSASFCEMKPEERRKVLFDLTGCKASKDKVRQMLLEEGADKDLAEQIIPMLRSGFPAAEQEAKERASQARGSWKAVTGETYGKQKAEGWEPAEIEDPSASDEANAGELSDKFDKNQRTLNELHQMLGKSKSVKQRLESLRESAGKVERIEVKQKTDLECLERTKKQLKRYEDARLSQDAMPCPCCDAMIVLRDGEFIDANKFGGSTLEPGRIQSELSQLRDSVAMMERTVRNNERDLDAAKSAQQEIDKLTEENGGDISQKSLDTFQSDIDALEKENAELRKAIDARNLAEAKYAQSLKAASEATKYHEEVTHWVLIAELMSSEGIPANILAQAMKPLQNLLGNINSLVPDWPPVTINHDMELLADSRLYTLLSESEQWRVQTVMTLALAQLSGINLAVLDRIDVLDLKSRIDLVEMLLELSDQNSELQVIMLGTLGKPAAGLPETIQHEWIAHGEIAKEQEAKAA